MLAPYLDEKVPRIFPDFIFDHAVLASYLYVFLPAVIAGLVIVFNRLRIKVVPTRASFILLSLGNLLLVMTLLAKGYIATQMIENIAVGENILLFAFTKLVSIPAMLIMAIGFYILLSRTMDEYIQRKSN